MGRGYRFWVRYLWQTISVGVAAAAVMFLLTGVGRQLEPGRRHAGRSALLPGAGQHPGTDADLLCHPPGLLSLWFWPWAAPGGRRSGAFLLYRAGAVAVTALLSLAILLPLAAGETWQVFPVLVLVLLFGCTLGSLMGLAYQKAEVYRDPDADGDFRHCGRFRFLLSGRRGRSRGNFRRAFCRPGPLCGGRRHSVAPQRCAGSVAYLPGPQAPGSKAVRRKLS